MNDDLARFGVDCSVLRGHFLTPREAILRSGLSAAALREAPGVVVVTTGDGARPTFPEFQFRRGPGAGFVDGLQDVVAALGGMLDGLQLAGWLQTNQPRLGGASVVEWLSKGRPHEAILALIPADRAAA